MPTPILTPVSTSPTVVLPSTGTYSAVNNGCSFKIYSNPTSDLYSADFITGACNQVSFVYNKLGGNILDIEIEASNVYQSYEESVLEYSYLLNLHQAKNSISSMLGNSTGSFDSNGILTGSLSSSLSGAHINLMFPRFSFGYAKKVASGIGTIVGVGGDKTIYSASFTIVEEVQDYDLQSIISGSSLTSSMDYYNKIGNKRIVIQRVYYKTPAAVWRFFGIYGGLNVGGNLMNYNPYGYGQWSDATTYEIVPVWEHKLQARAYEDNIYTRCSHYSYELRNNKLRIYPIPVSVTSMTPSKFWVEFYVEDDAFETDNDGQKNNMEGIANVGNLPFDNLPFDKINAIGKQFIRNYSLALCKESLGQVRSKFSPVPIPGTTINLNGEQLLTQAIEEKKMLKEELQKTLDELTYVELAKKDAEIAENVQRTQITIPNLIFVG